MDKKSQISLTSETNKWFERAAFARRQLFRTRDSTKRFQHVYVLQSAEKRR